MKRAERRWTKYAKKLQEAGAPHVSELRPGPRMPRTDKEMQQHLSGRSPSFRGPITRAERRWWDWYWKLRGRGFTKPLYKGDSEKRKKRAEKQSKKRTEKRLNNNRPKGKKVR